MLIKSLCLKGYTANRLTDDFSEKSCTKRGVNKLFRKLRDTGTVDSRPDSNRSRGVKKTLSFFFRSSHSLPLTLFCRLSGEETENTFSFVKKIVGGRLRKLLKQKLSTFHANNMHSCSRLSAPVHGAS